MTICVGILFNGGFVVAADTQETAGDSKMDQQKLFHFCSGNIHPGTSDPLGTMGILTGAGEAGALDAFFYLISREAGNCTGMKDFEKYLSDELVAFHVNHIFPTSITGQVPQVMQVMAAITCGWRSSLFVTYGSTVRRVYFHTAIGYGAHFAQSILNQRSWCQTQEEAQLLSAYVIHATKEHVVGCGLHTSISTLHDCPEECDSDGNPSYRQPNCPMEIGFDQEVLRKWETSFDTKWKSRHKALLGDLIADQLRENQII